MAEVYIVTATCRNCGRENRGLRVPKGTPLADVECRSCKCGGRLVRKVTKRFPTDIKEVTSPQNSEEVELA
jgi:hypothetical protein